MRVALALLGASSLALADLACDKDSLGNAVIIAGAPSSCTLPQEEVVDNFAVAELGSEHSLIATGIGTHVFDVFDEAYGDAITTYTKGSLPAAKYYCEALAKPSRPDFDPAGWGRIQGCSAQDWVGKMRDLFSPDDTCPESTRYVTLVGGKLHVSASHTDAGCTSTWGIKYDPTTTVDPIITLSESDSCTGKVSFRSKVPPGDAIYDDAQALRPSRPHNLHCTQPSPPHATTSPHATTATRKRLHPSLAFPAAPHTRTTRTLTRIARHRVRRRARSTSR